MLKIILISIFTFLSAQDIEEELDRFDKVKISVSARTTIEFGDEYRIEIDGREKDIDRIRFSVQGKTLVIEDKRRGFFKWSDNHDRVEIRIVTKKLVAGSFNGSGDVVIDPLKNKRFDLSISGSSDVRMSGVAKDLSIEIQGSGDLVYKDMESDLVSIELRGSGDVKADGIAGEVEIEIKGSGDVKAGRLEAESLDASIYGSGDIDVSVSEEVRALIYGSGDIRFRGDARIIKEKIYGSGDLERD